MSGNEVGGLLKSGKNVKLDKRLKPRYPLSLCLSHSLSLSLSLNECGYECVYVSLMFFSVNIFKNLNNSLYISLSLYLSMTTRCLTLVTLITLITLSLSSSLSTKVRYVYMWYSGVVMLSLMMIMGMIK